MPSENAELTRWRPRAGAVAENKRWEFEVGVEVKMRRASTFLILSLLPLAAACAGQTAQVYLNTVATSENGTPLAQGTFRLEKGAQGLNAPDRSTKGHVDEPVPMYVLASYVLAPAPVMLKFEQFEGTVATRLGDWNAKAVMTFDGYETAAGPAGTFPRALRHKTVITEAQADSSEGRAFVNGTRYLWFAQGVGLVRMRYEHANGRVTEAVLLSCKVSGSDDYLPLREGNRWTYAWKNEYRPGALIETWTVSNRPEGYQKDTESRAGTSEPREETPAVDSDGVKLVPAQDTLLKTAARPAQGFHFPYYLFIPHTLAHYQDLYLLVEMNNTGTTSDDFTLHDQRAKRLAEGSYANQMARKLDVPLLVPVFPRPGAQWQMYTHSLDEETLAVTSGPLQRIDLQLIRMIRDAQALLRRNGVQVHDKVLMHGFSASGVFANRFAILHPQVVRAVAAGGVNAIPTFATASWHGTTLPYPVGIADLERLAGIRFDGNAYRQVSQYIYMGYLDRNDTTLSRDAFSEEHAQLVRTLIGADMGERWKVSQSIYCELGAAAQCVTYNGTAHTIRLEMIEDIVRFFQANTGDGFVNIEPHEYPFVEFREIKVAHVKGLYWQGDERIPEWARNLDDGRADFTIAIADWMEGQSYQQLSDFLGKVVFEFVLHAEGHEDIRIVRDFSHGTHSAGDGTFQGFMVALPPAAREEIARGVPYTLTPVHQDKEYYWEVGEGATLVRP
jgi:hypothetical protein